MYSNAFIRGIAAIACCLIQLLLLQTQPGSAQFLDPLCGIRHEPKIVSRVINGTIAGVNSSPWMVLLRSKNTFICAGTLITSRLVLTAAHCFIPNKRLEAVLGEFDRDKIVDVRESESTTVEVHEVDMGFRNRLYSPTTHANDIAILRLKTTVMYKNHILPICIVLDKNWRQYIDNIMYLTGTGWGRTEDEGDSGLLRTVDLRRQSQDTCRYHTNGILMSNQFCAGNWDSNLCNGDSGGPVGALVPYGNGHRFIQIGIASFTNTQCEKASVFTDLLSHVDWILRVYRLYGNGFTRERIAQPYRPRYSTPWI